MIVKYTSKHKPEYERLIKLLWPDISQHDIDEIIDEHTTKCNTIFLYLINDNAVAFLNSSIRNDYVEGSDQSPTGYIEGIYVLPELTRQGIARSLVAHLIHFYKTINIKSIGSDIEIDNKDSDLFHQHIGFKEASINKHFIMKLENE